MKEKITQTAGRTALGDFAPEFAQFFADMLGDRNKHYEEVMSCGRETASTLTQAYIDLIGSVH